MFDQGSNVIDIADLVAARVAAEAEFLPVATVVEAESDEITSEFIRTCLIHNEVGDGMLYARLQRDQMVFIKKSQEWLLFSGHYWEQDVFDQYVRRVGAVASVYEEEAHSIRPQITRLQERLSELNQSIKALETAVKAKEKRRDQALKDGDSVTANILTEEILKESGDISNETLRRINLLNEISVAGESKKALERRVSKLRGQRGAQNCAYWAHIIDNPLAISGDELDQHPYLLPCANGVVHLETGESRPGRANDWLSKGLSIDYTGFNTPCPEWEKFLHTSCPDDEVVDFMQELFGYSSSGLTLEQFIAVFGGKGRNGKGVLFEMLEQVLGPMYWTVQSELLLDSKNARSSAGASPDILALRGRRIAAASETDQGRRISAARVKELTGSDTLNGRLLYDKADTNFRPTHKLFLRTNDVPAGLTKDFALRERLIYIRFPYMFVDDPLAKAKSDPNNADYYRLKDRGLKDRLIQERSGILSWLVRGYAKWQKRGKLLIPESCLQAAKKLEEDEDLIGQFISSCCAQAPVSHKESFKHIYGAFAEWLLETQATRKEDVQSGKWFGKELDKKGFRRETSGGSAWVYGLALTTAGVSQSGWSE